MRGEAADPIKARSTIASKNQVYFRSGCRRTPQKQLAREASIDCRQGWRARSSRGLAQNDRADRQIEPILLMRKHMLAGAANVRLTLTMSLGIAPIVRSERYGRRSHVILALGQLLPNRAGHLLASAIAVSSQHSRFPRQNAAQPAFLWRPLFAKLNVRRAWRR